MRKIVKTTEPLTLTNYRSSIPKTNKLDSNIYNDFPDKNKLDCNSNKSGNLRKQLLEEQGYICCYCMQRISCDNSRIEHFKSQEHNRKYQIQYKNLFVACNNSHGKSFAEQHCDVRKADIDLTTKLNLSSSSSINKIKYKNDCTIYSDDNDIDTDINNILNLNLEIIKKSRLQALNNLTQCIIAWDKNTLDKLIQKYSIKNSEGKYAQFSEMLVWKLKKKVRQYGNI